MFDVIIIHPYAPGHNNYVAVLTETSPSISILVGNSSQGINPRSPHALVKEYIEHEGLRMIDFFKLMDKDHSGSISRDEFVVGLTVSAALLVVVL